MKKLLLLTLFASFCGTASYAQKDKEAPLTYVSATAKLDKYFTEEELMKLGKLELTQIYMSRISALVEILPYIALHPKPGATLQEMGIPADPKTSTGANNIKHVENSTKNKSAYLGSVKITLDDIIPYADKVNIVKAILFYEDVIKRTETF
ncbi:MAG: hypothetical protein RLZZ175_2956 [Bacteroidota bacterium]|jgi:hypothetical protein